jgi:hypothetical protein
MIATLLLARKWKLLEMDVSVDADVDVSVERSIIRMKS